MAISIVPGSAAIRIASRPSVGAPQIGPTNVSFPSGWIRAYGSVQFNIDPGDATSNWFAGFIQAQWIETNWGYYRGQSNTEGSAFYQRARPPARAAQACRDTVGPVADIFYATQPRYRSPIPAGPYLSGHPMQASAMFEDSPSEFYPLSVTNNSTHKLNYLAEVQLEFHFCTVFVVRDPAGNFHQLKHFYWNCHWQYNFAHRGYPPTAANTTVVPVAAGIGAHISPVYSGAVTDRRFVGVLTSAHETKSCNNVASDELSHQIIRTSPTWHNFDVRH
jgi:hypothetical protein